MQQLRTTLLISFIVALAACNAKPDNNANATLTGKKAQLEELKKQHDKLTGEITKLEAEIRQLDPSTKTKRQSW